jgi:hypothetical protein
MEVWQRATHIQPTARLRSSTAMATSLTSQLLETDIVFKGVKSIGQQDFTISVLAGMMLKQVVGSPKIQLVLMVVLINMFSADEHGLWNNKGEANE